MDMFSKISLTYAVHFAMGLFEKLQLCLNNTELCIACWMHC